MNEVIKRKEILVSEILLAILMLIAFLEYYKYILYLPIVIFTPLVIYTIIISEVSYLQLNSSFITIKFGILHFFQFSKSYKFIREAV